MIYALIFNNNVGSYMKCILTYINVIFLLDILASNFKLDIKKSLYEYSYKNLINLVIITLPSYSGGEIQDYLKQFLHV